MNNIFANLKTINFDQYKIALYFAAIFTLIFNLYVVVFRINLFAQNYSFLHSLQIGIAELLVIFVINFVVFFLLSQSKLFFTPITIFLFTSCAALLYFVVSVNIVIDEKMIGSIFATDFGEAGEIINWQFILLVLLVLILSSAATFFIKITKLRFSLANFYKIIATIFLPLILALIINHRAFSNGGALVITSSYLPYNYIGNGFKYFKRSPQSLAKNKIDLYKKYQFAFDAKKNQDLIVVMVIGESSRVYNYSLAGYQRKTNPNLESVDNLIFFKNATSCARFTHYSVPCIMVRTKSKDFEFPLKETSAISIFRNLGFSTSWIDLQQAYSASNMPVFQIASEADFMMFRSGFKNKIPSGEKLLDEHMLPTYSEIVESDIKKPKFIAVHMMGSHWRYEERYPDKFRQFNPVCNSSVNLCSKNQIINSYDNTILYTDYFLSQIIDRLRDKNAIIVYTSDHGESLGEGGAFLHGTGPETKEQFAVPIIWWASDKFLADKDRKARFLKMKSKATKHISHDNIFFSILGCSGVSSDMIEKDLNLCN